MQRGDRIAGPEETQLAQGDKEEQDRVEEEERLQCLLLKDRMMEETLECLAC